MIEAERKDTALKFEKLVVDMMEIGLEERIPTTEHISQALIRMDGISSKWPAFGSLMPLGKYLAIGMMQLWNNLVVEDQSPGSGMS